jgi:hypothetical protein
MSEHRDRPYPTDLNDAEWGVPPHLGIKHLGALRTLRARFITVDEGLTRLTSDGGVAQFQVGGAVLAGRMGAKAVHFPAYETVSYVDTLRFAIWPAMS